MTISAFKDSLSHGNPPETMPVLLKALWYDAEGDWNASHSLAQEVESREGCWVHAYLHRKEGDDSNAAYWYRKAGMKFPEMSLDQEFEEIVKALLA